MAQRSLLKDAKWTMCGNPQAAGTSEQFSTVLDMAGYTSVLFLVSFGDNTSGTVLTAVVRSNPTSSTSTGTLEGTCTVTSASATDTDNALMIVDVEKPTQRFVFLDVTRTTQNATINCMIAVQYNASSVPQTQGATVIASAFAGPNA